MTERLPCMIVSDALTPEQRERIRNRWGQMNPHYAGAPTEDILDIMYDADACLDVREPLFEEHGELWIRELPAAVTSMIVLATVMLGTPDWARVQAVQGIQRRILNPRRRTQ